MMMIYCCYSKKFCIKILSSISLYNEFRNFRLEILYFRVLNLTSAFNCTKNFAYYNFSKTLLKISVAEKAVNHPDYNI